MPERTKLHILNTFNKMVRRKSFDKITVDSICQEADIGRTTFYRYFTDKYDILEYSMYQTFEQARQDQSIETFEDLFLFIGKAAIDYWRPLAKLYDSTAIETLHSAYVKCSEEIAASFIEKIRGNQPLSPEETVQLHVICHGCSHLFEDYTKGRIVIDPENLAGAVYELVPEQFKGRRTPNEEQ